MLKKLEVETKNCSRKLISIQKRFTLPFVKTKVFLKFTVNCHASRYEERKQSTTPRSKEFSCVHTEQKRHGQLKNCYSNQTGLKFF